jgi:hypothetical protein
MDGVPWGCGRRGHSHEGNRTIMQKPTIHVHQDTVYRALAQVPDRPEHDYTYGASNPALRPQVES